MSTERKDPPKTRLRVIFATIAFCVVLFQVVKTEIHVADLRSRGFTDVVTTSARNHAYAPLVGAIAGALLFTGIGIGLRRLVRKPEEEE